MRILSDEMVNADVQAVADTCDVEVQTEVEESKFEINPGKFSLLPVSEKLSFS